MPRILRVARILCVCVAAWHSRNNGHEMKTNQGNSLPSRRADRDREREGVRETKRGRNEEREAPKQTPKVSGMKGEPPKKKKGPVSGNDKAHHDDDDDNEDAAAAADDDVDEPFARDCEC